MSEAVNTHRLTFACDDVRYVRKDRPEVWITPNKINGQMFVGYPMVSFIPGSQGMDEPIQFGDFVIDIDTQEIACQDAIKIVNWFQAVYGVDLEQWRIYLSGKKGIHLELPAEIFSVENGHQYLTLGFKRLAKDLEGELQVKLDTSMYTRGTPKPYRQANVLRDTGTCKRQIEFNDLYEITTDEEYRESCREPGPIWQPADISRNNLLAAKMQAYLAESVEQQAIIRNAPSLSADEIERLGLDIPPCIKVLANATQYIKGNTFNDVALQLTAYAVTSGRTEAEFLGGCSRFIENYPSTSLNTSEKRYENCRARFRTMAANGNSHSCGGILSLKVPGFECKDCDAHIQGPATTIQVMSDDDMQDSPRTLTIPPAVLAPGGLINVGMAALSSPGMPDIKQYNIAVVLTTIANAIAGKVTFRNVWPNVFNIKVGPTSTGKTSSDKTMVRAINDIGLTGFYGATDFASGPALMRSLVTKPVQMMVLDECTSMFRRYEKSDGIGDGKRDALLEIFSASGGKISKMYADAKNAINIDYPCLSLTGNATTTIFDAIKQEDFDTGTMQRFDFWAYDGPTPARGLGGDEENEDLVKFAEGIARICDARPPSAEGVVDLTGYGNRGKPFKLGITRQGEKVLLDWSQEITQKCNDAGSDGDKGIISREFDLCIKYAMIHAAGTREVDYLFLPLDEFDIEYGKTVAWMLGHWKINSLKDQVTTGDFHQRCSMFMAARDAVQRTGNRPTFKLMANRRPQLKNWKLRESAEVIDVLLKRGEIVLDDSKKHTVYFRPKEIST